MSVNEYQHDFPEPVADVIIQRWYRKAIQTGRLVKLEVAGQKGENIALRLYYQEQFDYMSFCEYGSFLLRAYERREHVKEYRAQLARYQEVENRGVAPYAERQQAKEKSRYIRRVLETIEMFNWLFFNYLELY